MAAIEHRIRLYGCLIAKSVQVVGTQLYRALWTKEEFPLGWPGYQEWSIAMMKTLFNVGSYVHWRNFIKVGMHRDMISQLLAGSAHHSSSSSTQLSEAGELYTLHLGAR